MKRFPIIIMLIFLASIFLSIFYYRRSIAIKYPKSTGGDRIEQVPANYQAEPDAMARLFKVLPLETTNFSITFDYKHGKYIVKGKNNSNLQTEFNKWYKDSLYKDILLSRFVLIEN